MKLPSHGGKIKGGEFVVAVLGKCLCGSDFSK